MTDRGALARARIRGASGPGRAETRVVGRVLPLAVLVVCAGMLAFLGLPVLALLARATGQGALGAAFSDPAVPAALVLSLCTTAVTTVIVIAVGTPLAFVLSRRRFPGAWLATAVVDLPIVLPPAVAGLALLLAFGRRGVLGPTLDVFGVSVSFTTAAVVMAQVFVASPFYIRAARTGFSYVDRDQEDAARVDGAGPLQVFRYVTVPGAWTALTAGLVLTWARALGEFGATIMFAGNISGRTQTLPLLVYAQFQSSLDAAIAGGAVLVLAALVVLLAVRLTHWRAALDLRSSL
jgi:molybdate transport system permease protein